MNRLLNGQRAPEMMDFAVSAKTLDDGLIEQLEDYVRNNPAATATVYKPVDFVATRDGIATSINKNNDFHGFHDYVYKEEKPNGTRTTAHDPGHVLPAGPGGLREALPVPGAGPRQGDWSDRPALLYARAGGECHSVQGRMKRAAPGAVTPGTAKVV